MAVVEGLELAEHMKEVALVPDQGAVQELAAAGLYPAFHDGVLDDGRTLCGCR
jgi:hypothetical protein